jgi:ubiquinone/menaquinone biosynthesis C-methylase UbiE
LSEKFGREQVREFWTAQAVQHQQSPAASWSDRMVIELEIREMSHRLAPGDRVLDVGCANGYSTVCYARDKAISIRGIDYIPEMIEHAKTRLAAASGLQGMVEFAVGNVLELDEATASYDKLVVTRVIINLDSWETQLQALEECARVLKPGGILLLSEATLQGWTKLNDFRAEWRLPPIPMPPFNRYIDVTQVVAAVDRSLELVEVVDFASTYYVGTRVMKPLLARMVDMTDKIADPEMHWNQWFAALPPAGDYGTQKLLVFRRR